MSLARVWLRRFEFSVPPATSVRLPRMRSDAQYFLARRDRLEPLAVAGLSKKRKKLAAGRAHASLREERSDDEVKPPWFFAIRMVRFAHHESRFAALALSSQVLLSTNPPSFEFGPPPWQCGSGSRGDLGGALSTEAARPSNCSLARCQMNSIR